MPIWDYECDNCGHKDWFMRSFDDRFEVDCPRCGAVMSFVGGFTRNRAIVYANDRNTSGGSIKRNGIEIPFTGPAQKGRILNDFNMVETGTEPVENVHSYFDEKEREHKAARSKERTKAIMESIQELGDALYTRDPGHETGEADFDRAARARELMSEHTGIKNPQAVGPDG